MASGTAFNVIYVGNFADWEASAGTSGLYVDVDDNGGTSEPNAEVMYGQVINGADLAVVSIQANETSTNNGVIGTDDYTNGPRTGTNFNTSGTYDDQPTYLRGDTIEYTLPDGTSYGDGTGTYYANSNDPGNTEGVAIDSVHWFRIAVSSPVRDGAGDIVYNPDGSMQTTEVEKLVVGFQTDVGDVFIQEYANSNSSIYNLDGLEISSIRFIESNGDNGVKDIRDTWSADGVTTIACFADGTMIETSRGQVAIEYLKVGDLVKTLDRGMQPLRWIGSRHLNAATLECNPKLRPIRIDAGVLGHGLPTTDLVVSRQHRMLVSSKITQRMFDQAEVLLPAIRLVGLGGIDVADDVSDVTYYHMMFDQHEVVFANAAPSESLHLGEYALESMLPEQLEEIETTFPDLENDLQAANLARFVPNTNRAMKELMRRHVKNNKCVLEIYKKPITNQIAAFIMQRNY